VTITDRMAAWRRERQVLARVSRAAWRLVQAGRERSRALASARAEGVLIRTLAAAAGLTPGPGAPDHGRRGPGRAGRRAGRVAGRGLARSRRPGGMTTPSWTGATWSAAAWSTRSAGSASASAGWQACMPRSSRRWSTCALRAIIPTGRTW